MIETSPDRPLDLDLPLLTERRYGDTLIRLYGVMRGSSASEAEEEPVS